MIGFCTFVFTAVLLSVTVTVADSEVTVRTRSGLLIGSNSGRSKLVTRFLGVPYADPPQRFEQASIVTPWAEPLNATNYGPACIQAKAINLPTPSGEAESCLTLDIYTPANLSDPDGVTPSRAVMVLIHGGGFTDGTSSIYEGSILAVTGDVVVVAIQYRLGVFGFLYSHGVFPSNVGLLDQKLALEWIRMNIQFFGGSKSRITIFGESAGAASISCHMFSPKMNNTVFQKAIMESGSYMSVAMNQSAINSSAYDFAKEVPSCAGLSLANLMICLRGASVEEITKALRKAAGRGLYMSPVVDGDYLPFSPAQIIAEYHENGPEGVAGMIGNLKQYDTLMGFNGQDGLLFLSFAKLDDHDLTNGITTKEFKSYVLNNKFPLPLLSNNKTLLARSLDGLFNYYVRRKVPGAGLTEEQINLRKLVNYLGDVGLAVPTVFHAEIHRAIVGTSRKSYCYLFDHKPSVPSRFDPKSPWLKFTANHADEVRFVFGYQSDLTDVEKALSDDMMKYWSNFAKNRDPTTPALVTTRQVEPWKEFTVNHMEYMRITTSKDYVDTGIREEELRLLSCVWTELNNNQPDPDCFTSSSGSGLLLSSVLRYCYSVLLFIKSFLI